MGTVNLKNVIAKKGFHIDLETDFDESKVNFFIKNRVTMENMSKI